MRAISVLCVLLFLAACGLAPRQSGGDILVIGDSVMAWNRSSGRDVGRVIGAELRREVVSRAALGARLQAGTITALGGLSIPGQISSGPWNWIVMNGGANDLASSCGCFRCEDEIDALISGDFASGVIPDLITRATLQGAQVLWVGYYEAPESKSFRGCRPGLVELERRIVEYARTKEGVFFIDTEEVFDPTASGLLAPDRAHPSVNGSALIGRFVAREIAKRSQP